MVRFWSMASVNCVFDDELLTSITGASATTCTVSLTDASDNVTSIVVVVPSGNTISARLTVLKPDSVASISNTPG